MQKAINIGNKEITLVSSGATPIFYRNEFGRDFFDDFGKFLELAQQAASAETDAEKAGVLFNKDITLVQDMAYIYAKNADVNIAPYDKWFEGFAVFPIFDILEDIGEIAMTSISTKKA